jgi:deoxyribonuclease-4
MVFENDKVRIGPPAVRDDLFMMPNAKGLLRKGKKAEIPEYLHNLGLNAYEFSGGRMASFSDSPEYAQFRKNIPKYDIAMSLHAPYYISLTSEKTETVISSIDRLANVYMWAVWLNASRIVLHPGTYGKKGKLPDLLKMIIEGTRKGLDRADELFPDYKDQFRNICLCMETMGKQGQIGPTEDILYLCKELGTDRVRPCIDFGHLYARECGKKEGRKFYEQEFAKVEKELGTAVVKHLHIHYSHIEYTDKGEKEHVPNTDKVFGPDVTPLYEIILEQGYTPIIINESPELEPDAKLLMDQFRSMQIKNEK